MTIKNVAYAKKEYINISDADPIWIQKWEILHTDSDPRKIII